MLKKHLQVGVVKGAITQEKADKQFEEWVSKKNAVQTGKTTALSNKKDEEKKSKLAAEAKVNEARKEAQKAKNLAALAAAEAAANPPAAEAQAETPAAEEPKAE